MAFVTRSGAQLVLNGQAFRFGGVNISWLGMYPSSPVAYPTTSDIDAALTTAKNLGFTVVRAHSLGVSVGTTLSVWPTLTTTNTTAFNTIDYAIYKAGLAGLRLIIPLVDNYHFALGGKHTFTDWESIADETQFYTNSTVISDFEAYISVMLNRVNQYNSVAYKNDPTILAWQTGNELVNPFPATSWSSTISAYIKSIDSNHLVMDGAGMTTTGMNTAAANLAISTLDIYDDHFYPPDLTRVASDASAVSGASKVYVAAEYDWLLYSSALLQSWHSTIEGNMAISGDLYWDLRVNVNPSDQYAFYYPGTTQEMQVRSSMLSRHAWLMSGKTSLPTSFGSLSAHA